MRLEQNRFALQLASYVWGSSYTGLYLLAPTL
jgi:hypothetical protein